MKNVIPIILILAAMVGFVMLVQPLYDSTSPLRSEIQAYNAAITKADELATLIDTKKADYNNLPTVDLDKLDAMIPNTDQATHILADLNALADKYGSAIDNIGVLRAPVSQEGSGAAYNQTLVSFSFSATYPNFLSFMKDLEKSLRILEVRSVTFEAKNSGTYDYNISIGIYSKPVQ